MQTTSKFYRINTVVVTLFFLVSICEVFLPNNAEARKAEGRTRTSVHQGGRNVQSRNAHRDRNMNKNVNRDVRRDRNVNRDIHRDRNVNVRRDVNVNVRDDRRYDHGGYHGRYYDDHHRHDVGAAFAVGAVTGLVVGSIVTAASMPPSCSVVNMNGIAYKQCGNTWYEPRYSGSQVNYIVVNPPR